MLRDQPLAEKGVEIEYTVTENTDEGGSKDYKSDADPRKIFFNEQGKLTSIYYIKEMKRIHGHLMK